MFLPKKIFLFVLFFHAKSKSLEIIFKIFVKGCAPMVCDCSLPFDALVYMSPAIGKKLLKMKSKAIDRCTTLNEIPFYQVTMQVALYPILAKAL